jgi:hypothetical protein
VKSKNTGLGRTKKNKANSLSFPRPNWAREQVQLKTYRTDDSTGEKKVFSLVFFDNLNQHIYLLSVYAFSDMLSPIKGCEGVNEFKFSLTN